MKILIGLLLTLVVGWAWHAPLGNGERMIGRLETQARAAVAQTNLPGIRVRLSRNPLARVATLSGPADDFQRNGMGSQPGLTGIVGAIPGMGAVKWTDEARTHGGALPLLAETLILAALAYLLGLALAWLLWGRRRAQA